MSSSSDPHDDFAGDDAEVVDAVPVETHDAPRVRAGRPAAAGTAAPAGGLTTPASRLPARGSVPVVAQAAAVAVTGFAAGAVTAAVVRGASKRRAVKAAKRSPRDLLPVVGTRSFLVDVHLRGPRDGREGATVLSIPRMSRNRQHGRAARRRAAA